MNLNPANTDFLIIAGSCDSSDLLDVKLLIQSLIFRKIPVTQIALVITFQNKIENFYLGDSPEDRMRFWLATCQLFLDHYRGLGIQVHSGENAEYGTALSKLRKSNLITIVAGHGSPNGIAISPSISPNALINDCRKFRRIKNCIAILGQCYSGNFNFIDADATNIKGARFCLIGATNYMPSYGISTEVYKKIRTNSIGDRVISTFSDSEPFTNISYTVNPFILTVVDWLIFPVDVDGDKKNSFMDCYKYVSGQVELVINRARAGALARLLLNPFAKDLEREAFTDAVDESLSISQTPWILHSRFAQTVTWNIEE